MASKLKNVKIRTLALTRRGANKNRKSVFKADGLGSIFVDLSDEEQKILKNKKPDVAKADFLLEVTGIVEQLRKGELTTEDAADFLEETVIKHEKDIPVEKGKGGGGGNDDVTPLDDLREIAGLRKKSGPEETTNLKEIREMVGLKN
jgi:hypothetical protein